MENNVKDTTKRKNNEENNGRLVKRNWWKIAIIVFVVLVILVGLSIGLYYAFKPQYSLNGNWNYDKVSNISDDIKDKEGNNVALFFYKEDDETTNWLTWEDPEGSKGENASDGVLTEVVNETDNTTYYAVNLDDYDSSNDIFLELFMDESSDDEEKYEFYDIYDDQFNGLGSDYNDYVSVNYYFDWSYSVDSTDNHDPQNPKDWWESNASNQYEIKNELNADDEWEHTFVNRDTSSTPEISTGTVMYFDGTTGKLLDVISGYGEIPDVSSDEWLESRNNLIDWFTFFDQATIEFDNH